MGPLAPSAPESRKVGKRAAFASPTRAIAATSWRSAARTSGRWRSVSAGMPTATVSGTLGIEPSDASRSCSAAGGWPSSVARACSVWARAVSRLGIWARVCSAFARACSTSSSEVSPAWARHRVRSSVSSWRARLLREIASRAW